MIENNLLFVETEDRAGRPALKVQGKFVCSSVDVKKEAEGWIRMISPRLRGMANLIVLGAGAGHHLAQLVPVFSPSRILVIEKSQECIQFCKTHHDLEMTEVRFLNPATPNEVMKSTAVSNFLSQPYTVVRFAPATNPDVAFYDQVEEVISARTPESFDFLIKCRPDLSQLFKVAPKTSVVRSQVKKMISIKNLRDTIAKDNESQELLLICALGELIA